METIVITQPAIESEKEQGIDWDMSHRKSTAWKTARRRRLMPGKEFSTTIIRKHFEIPYSPPTKRTEIKTVGLHLEIEELYCQAYFPIVNYGNGLKYASICTVDGELVCFESEKPLTKPGVYRFEKPNLEMPDRMCGTLKIFKVRIIAQNGM